MNMILAISRSSRSYGMPLSSFRSLKSLQWTAMSVPRITTTTTFTGTITSRRLLSTSRTGFHDTPWLRWTLYGIAITTVGIGVDKIFNDSAIFNDIRNNVPLKAIDNGIHQLVPEKNSDTYEMGLFDASQLEELNQQKDYRAKKLTKGSWVFRIWYYIKFTTYDYVIDPAIVFVRFLELSMIFLPLLISAPICWFGSKDKDHENVRSGAKLWYRYLKWSAEIAGASFIKLGQWAASRTDIFPRALCDQLEQLHSNAKAHLLSATKKIVSQSFGGMPFEEIFDEFNEEPVGVGAIAQVYIANLSEKVLDRAKKDDFERTQRENSGDEGNLLPRIMITEQTIKPNQKVAIKVLHPQVEDKINRDLRIMMFFAKFINAIPTMEWLSLPDEVEQFSLLMRLQLDLRIEGFNLLKFRENFKDRLDIHFPKPYINFTTRQVLVEEFMYAIPMSKLLSLKENYGKNLSKEVSDKGLEAFLKMLILDNFVHADLHPGNMMVRFYKNEHFKHEKEYKIVKLSNEAETHRITKELLDLGDDHQALTKRLESLYEDGYHAEICFLDVGLITELNHKDRVNFIDLFKALSEFDGYKAGELMVERSRTPETAINKEIFALKVEKLVDQMKERTFTLGNISIGDLLDQVLGMVRTHHVRMEGDFITVIVAILLLEGIGRQLDPDLDLFASSLPVLRKLGILKEGREILRNESSLSMIKVWLVLEVRQFINASIQDIHALVKADMLSPNI